MWGRLDGVIALVKSPRKKLRHLLEHLITLGTARSWSTMMMPVCMNGISNRAPSQS